jgi:hypothetical protein
MLIKVLHNRAEAEKPQDNENCLNPNKASIREKDSPSHIFLFLRG